LLLSDWLEGTDIMSNLVFPGHSGNTSAATILIYCGAVHIMVTKHELMFPSAASDTSHHARCRD